MNNDTTYVYRGARNDAVCTEVHGEGKLNMAARRAGQKVFDWAKINSVLPDYLKADFLKFRGSYEAKKAK